MHCRGWKAQELQKHKIWLVLAKTAKPFCMMKALA
jgi:hypothetical protein